MQFFYLEDLTLILSLINIQDLCALCSRTLAIIWQFKIEIDLAEPII